MKTAVTASRMRKIEDIAINTYKIPELILMENAARAAANAASGAAFVRIFCGKGNNGADGVAAARHLVTRGAKAEIVFIKEAPDNLNVEIARAMGIPMIDFSSMDKERVPDAIIDAIFGTGLSGEVTGAAKDAIAYINKTPATVVSVDIPSGICSDTGAVLGVAVRADKTVTFGCYKQGLLQYPGKDFAGEVELCDISIPKEAVEAVGAKTFLVDAVRLPKRAGDAHKGNFGRVLTICGSAGMAGAAYMATTAAVRGGAGLVTAMVPDCIKNHVAKRLTEAMVVSLTDDGEAIDTSAVDIILEKAKTADAILIGCGMRNTQKTAYLVKEVVNTGATVVVDADGLNAVADCPEVLRGTTITPHPKELSRLMRISVDEIQKNRIETAREFSKKYDCTVVLKGAATVTAYPDGRAFINPTGNPGMATGGTGDVLAGLCTAFLAQKIENAQAAAVYIHGRTGDICKEKTGAYALAAGDLLKKLPVAMKEAEQG